MSNPALVENGKPVPIEGSSITDATASDLVDAALPSGKHKAHGKCFRCKLNRRSGARACGTDTVRILDVVSPKRPTWILMSKGNAKYVHVEHFTMVSRPDGSRRR